jgi:hypothetical protein
MKNMERTLKLTYAIIYILFLFAVLMLFVAVNKTASVSGSINLFILLTLILGTAIFGIALLNMRITVNEQNKIELTKKEISNNDNSVDIAGKEVEKELDIKELLPSTSTQIDKYTDEVLQNMAETFGIVQGLLYLKQPNEDNYECSATYAYFSDQKPESFKSGETLPGQAVKNKTLVVLNDVPEKYMTIVSGLGKSLPRQLVFVPLKHQDEIVGLIEYATFELISDKQQKALDAISKKIAETIVKLLKKVK